jgi:hypothetical protein
LSIPRNGYDKHKADLIKVMGHAPPDLFGLTEIMEQEQALKDLIDAVRSTD